MVKGNTTIGAGASPATLAVKTERSPALGWRIGFWVSTAIAIIAVGRRLYVLTFPPRGSVPELSALDSYFASHAALTLAHILPALAFVVLAPLVVFRKTDAPSWAFRLLIPLGGVIGITAYALSVDAFGGWVERSAVLLFNSLFLCSLFRAYSSMRRRQELQHRRWMLRAIVILLGIATTRPVMGVFFATSRFTHLEPRQFFGWAFWIGFSINTVVIEWRLRTRADSALSVPATKND